MYNNYIKLTEQHTRDKTRTIYANLDKMYMIAENGKGSRLFFDAVMVDVLETPAQVMDIQTIVITDKEEVDGRSRDEGVVENP